MSVRPATQGGGPLSAEELEAWTRAEEALSCASPQPTGEWSLARTKVEAYRNVCGPRLLAQFHALEEQLARVMAIAADEIAQVRGQRDELASYAIDLRRWLAEAAATEPPGLGATDEEIMRFVEHLCTVAPARRSA